MSSYLLKPPCLLSLPNSGANYVDSKMPVCLGNTSAKKNTEDSAETFENYVSNGFGMPQHFAKGSDLVF